MNLKIKFEGNNFILHFGDNVDALMLNDKLSANELIDAIAENNVTKITLEDGARIQFDNMDNNAFEYILINALINASNEIQSEIKVSNKDDS